VGANAMHPLPLIQLHDLDRLTVLDRSLVQGDRVWGEALCRKSVGGFPSLDAGARSCSAKAPAAGVAAVG
jgi:hypothetical protein